jgi:hypothetical protein
MTFECWSCGQAHKILWGGRWWLPPSSGRDESYESVFARGSSMHQKCFNYALTNLLFGFCKFMWVINLLVILPSPYLGVPASPSTPKMLRAMERAPTPHSSVVFTLDSHLNILRSLGVCHHQLMVLWTNLFFHTPNLSLHFNLSKYAFWTHWF